MKTAPQLWQEIRETEVRPGTLTLWWLYQAGVAFKTPGGTIAVVDPYLSDAVLRSYHLPRNVPAPLDPGEVDADVILATHSHADHLDPDAIAPFMSHERVPIRGAAHGRRQGGRNRRRTRSGPSRWPGETS